MSRRSPPGIPAVLDVFWVFLRLGVTSFGGPIAHIAYFRDEFVVQKQWLDGEEFAALAALCQFLPGPASSQLGFAIGLRRAGWAGALAAFLGFTLPSAMAMYAAAVCLPGLLSTTPGGQALLHGLKLVAVVVVAHGVWGMARGLAPDIRRAVIALAAAALSLALPGSIGQLASIAAGALLGVLLCRNVAQPLPQGASCGISPRMALMAATLFCVGMGLAFLPATSQPTLAGVAATHYQAGALVFGGGHVVLPLLDARLVETGWMGPEQFLAGYGAAQAMPGPMFTLASYLGAGVETGHNPLAGSVVATLAIFFPGFALLVAALPAWEALRRTPVLAAAVNGTGAAVVGLLLSALYDPLWRTSILDARDVAILLGGLGFCAVLRRPIFAVLPWCVGMAWLWP